MGSPTKGDLRYPGGVPFKPPTNNSFKRFIAIDTASVAAALAALDGGAVAEIVTRTTEGGDSGLGGEVGVKGAKLSGGRNRQHKIEEEHRRVRTEHSAASALVTRLSDSGSVGEITGDLNDEIVDQLQIGMVVHFVAEVTLHPLQQAAVLFDEYLLQAPKFGIKDGLAEAKTVSKLLKAMLGSDRSNPNIAVDFAAAPGSKVRWTGGFPAAGLQVPLEDLHGRVHVLAQADAVSLQGDPIHALRLVRGTPPSQVEIDAATEFANGFGEAMADVGVSLGIDDIMMPTPITTLRILCAWR